MIEDYMSLRNIDVYKNILNYIFKEQLTNSFDNFWIICVVFYSLYYPYFAITFDNFLKNIGEFKVFSFFFYE